MAVDNRLTAEQLAALVPGDPVTIELARDFRRPKHVAGVVVRFVGSQVVVSCRSDRGVPYVHHFDRRGVRVGGGGYAELVADEATGPTVTDVRPRTARVDDAYRQWARNRDDLENLIRLRDAVEGYLNGQLSSVD